jgi:nucleotide-binding universal stress UspA family protein
MYGRVLIGFDGSPASKEAVRAGIEVATATDGEATILIVASAEHGETKEDRRIAFEQTIVTLRASALEELDRLPKGRATAAIQVASGDDPAEVVAAYAREHAFDLLVVGRHGLDRASHAGLGRMTRRLAETAPIHLLLVE